MWIYPDFSQKLNVFISLSATHLIDSEGTTVGSTPDWAFNTNTGKTGS